MRTSERFRALPAYPLAGMKEVRRRIEAEGVDVIDLGTGDAQLDPPPRVVERLREVAGDMSYSRYGFQSGLAELRESIADWMRVRFGVRVDADTEVVPLIGSKEGIAHLPFALVGPGDVGIVPDPGYQAYLGGITLAGGEPYLMRLERAHDFLVPLEAVPPDVARRTRILYLNYPNNPTTAVAPDDYYRAAIDFCHRHGAVLVHDHAYSEIGFDGYRPRSVLELDGARDVAIEFHSFSKTYNMTGWRLGWAVGNPELVGALTRVKTFVDTGGYLGIQAAGVAALEGWAEWVPGNVATFQRRRDAAVGAFREAGFDVECPRATMYLWIPVPPGTSSEAFARRALEQAGVIVLPGASLGRGGEGYFRVALTVPESRLADAAARLGGLG
jgi:LL-diaminopimelate aminotransferase